MGVNPPIKMVQKIYVCVKANGQKDIPDRWSQRGHLQGVTQEKGGGLIEHHAGYQTDTKEEIWYWEREKG